MHRLASIAASIVLGATGCVSHSIAQTPSTVPRGETRVGVGVGFSQSRPDDSAGLPQELSLRVGLHDRVDVGVKTNWMSIEAEVKAQLVRGAFDLALAVAGGVATDPDADAPFGDDTRTENGMYSARARLIAGQRLAKGVELVLSAGSLLGFRGGTLDEPVGAWHDRAFAVGGGIGLLLGADPQLLPEVVAMQVVDGDAPVGGAMDRGATLLQVTVTGLFGAAEGDEGAGSR